MMISIIICTEENNDNNYDYCIAVNQFSDDL